MSASQKRQRPMLLQARCTLDEFAKVEADAQAAGLSVSGYLRFLVFGAITPRTRRAKPGPDIKLLAVLLGRLGMIGNNLNQLVRLGNQGQFIPPAELKAALAAVEAAAQRIEAALE